MTIRDIGILFGYKVDKSTESNVENSVKSLKEMATKMLGGVAVVVAVKKAAQFVQDCVSIASEVEEMENKFNVVFDSLGNQVDQWAQDYADAIGRNKNTIKGYLADQQNLLVGFGMTREAGAELSKQMTTLALDLASFANMDEDTAVNAMTKAVMGESEAAKTLGAVLNDDTRAQAMLTLGLSGTYESLDQLTKMQVNYQAILSQSPDAIGDCERSLGSYESTTRQFQAKLLEVKQLIGQFFMPTFQKVLSYGTRGLTMLRNIIQKISDFAAKVGGAEKIIKVFGAALGITFALTNVSKITKMVEAVRKLAKTFGTSHSKVLLLFAAILLLVLIVQDFIAFMNGGQSLFGTMLEKAGVDVDKFRSDVIAIWENIQTALGAIWQGIQNVAIPIFQGIWKTIQTVFNAIGGVIEKIAPKFAEFINQLASGEVNTDQWVAVGETIAKIVAVVVGAITVVKTVITVVKTAVSVVRGISTVVSLLTSPIGLVVLAIAALIAIIVLCVQHWDEIKAKAAEVWQAIVGAFSAAGEWFYNNVVQPVVDFFTGLWESITTIFTNIWTSITTTVSNIKESIVEGLTAAIDWIKSLPEQAIQWGADIIQGIVDGIKGAISWVGDAVSGVADKIKSFLGFSEPEDGPLSDFHTYMPDMMDLMAQGITTGKEKVKAALEVVTGDMSVIAKSNVVSPGTAKTASTGGVSSRTVTQNVEINNQFNGDRAGQEKSSKAMDKASDDATSEMARALAFAR